MLEFRNYAEMYAHYKAVKTRLHPAARPPRYVKPVVTPVVSDTPKTQGGALNWRAVQEAAGSIEPYLKPRPSAHTLSIKHIQLCVGHYYRVSLLELQSPRREARIVLPRQIAMFLVKTLTMRSLPEIGRMFGGRDHTTVLHAVRKIASLIESDDQLRADIEIIKEQISRPPPINPDTGGASVVHMETTPITDKPHESTGGLETNPRSPDASTQPEEGINGCGQ